MPLGRKIRNLWELKRKPDGDRYDISEIAREASRLYRERQILLTSEELRCTGASLPEIERACEEIRGQRDVLSRQYLSELKDGKRRNPTFNVIEALSLFFEVSPAYFSIGPDATEETRAAEQEVEAITALRQLTKQMEEGGESNAMELVGALMRGGMQLNPQMAAGMFRMQLAVIQAAAQDRNEEPTP